MARISILNGVTEVDVQEVVIGSAFRMGLYVEEVIADAFYAFDFADFAFHASVRESHDSPTEITAFDVSARPGEPGWIDLVLDGNKTGILQDQIDYAASVKAWSTGQSTEAVTLVKMTLHASLLASR